jgi:HEAT repeat protein/tetratricopeptide (TPR) repeat protein
VQLDRELLLEHDVVAVALERARSYPEAVARWVDIEARARQSGDALLAREARESLVKLWELEHALEAQAGPLAARFMASPPDVDAGRTLAEVQRRLRRLGEAEETLRRVIKLAPGDAESHRALVTVLKQSNKPDKLDQALAVLEELVAIDPKRARETYQEMAAMAADNLHDPDHDRRAIHYQQRAVELNPEDAEGHMKLGVEYETLLQDGEHAIREYRAAIQKNDRLFEVYFRLSALLASRGEVAEADRLRRIVIRRAPDDDLVKRAADLALQTNLENGTLESLEQELLPLAIGSPQRPLYRRLLVRLYEGLTWGFVQRARAGGADADAAKAALARIGARAVKPLLDALADSDESQQRTAINVLGFVRNRNAGPALFAFATGNADVALRERAMVACGQLRDPGLLPKLDGFLSRQADAPSDTVAVAAVWSVARMNEPRALPLLRRLALRGSPEARAMALLGLGALRDRASQAEVAQVATEGGAGNAARAAATYVLGELGGEESATTLLTLAADADPLTREMALIALGQSGVGRVRERAIAAMADAVFEGGDPGSPRSLAMAERVRRAGCAALVMAARSGEKGGRAPEAVDPLAFVDDSVVVEEILQRVVPTALDAKDRASALVTFATPLERAARLALSVGDRAKAVFDAMQGGVGAFEPFVGADGSEAARETVRSIARGLEPEIVRFASDQDPAVRARATLLLSRSSSPAAADALVQALGDPVPDVQRAALAAIGSRPDPGAVAAVRRALLARDGLTAGEEPWAMRVLAAQAMGRLGAAGAHAEAEASLRTAATSDAYALVREASLRALESFDPTAARAVARSLASDPEPRVRDAAKHLVAP